MKMSSKELSDLLDRECENTRAHTTAADSPVVIEERAQVAVILTEARQTEHDLRVKIRELDAQLAEKDRDNRRMHEHRVEAGAQIEKLQCAIATLEAKLASPPKRKPRQRKRR